MDWAVLGTVIGIAVANLGIILPLLLRMHKDIGILLGRTEDIPQIRQNIQQNAADIAVLKSQAQAQPAVSPSQVSGTTTPAPV